MRLALLLLSFMFALPAIGDGNTDEPKEQIPVTSDSYESIRLNISGGYVSGAYDGEQVNGAELGVDASMHVFTVPITVTSKSAFATTRESVLTGSAFKGHEKRSKGRHRSVLLGDSRLRVVDWSTNLLFDVGDISMRMLGWWPLPIWTHTYAGGGIGLMWVERMRVSELSFAGQAVAGMRAVITRRFALYAEGVSTMPSSGSLENFVSGRAGMRWNF